MAKRRESDSTGDTKPGDQNGFRSQKGPLARLPFLQSL